MLKQRPRSRADGRPSTVSSQDSLATNMAFEIVRATTPHLASARSMASPISKGGMSGSLSAPSLSTFGGSSADFLDVSVYEPHTTGSSIGGLPPASPVFNFASISMNNSLKSSLNNTSLLADKKTLGINKYKQMKFESLKPKSKPEYTTVCGKATVSRKWTKQMSLNAQQVLTDNKGWSNKTDAHEKRLEWQDREDRRWLREHNKSHFNSFIHAETLQAHKNKVSAGQAGFFGKCNQGSFEIDEEKPYKHEFRDWDRLPVFYN